MKRKLVAALSMLCVSAAQATSVFINELHYDNAGTDSGEFVEVAAPAGTDLTGWQVVFYNGSNGTVYRTESLSGTVTDSSDGYGFAVISLPANGIQNGGPDGFALINNTGAVVQFLSYEGSFAATNGVANGLTSEDIGVNEGGSDPAGESLQLAGIGNEYADFTWQGSDAATANALNNGQSFGDAIVDNPPTVSITPANGDVNVAVDANISLVFSEDVVLSGTNMISCTSEVAITATLTGGGRSYTLDPDQDFASMDVCSFTLSASDVTDLDGTPDNLAEDVTVSFSVVDTSATIDFVINEIHADPAANLPGDANGDGTRDFAQDEFVELVNVGELATDISGWTLSDSQVRHLFPAGSVVEPGCAVVVFGGGAPTGVFGGALVQTATGGQVGLSNGGDTVTLSNGVISIEASYTGSQGGNNQSVTRNPDVTGELSTQHSTIAEANGALFSPGTRLDGTPFSGCTIPDVAPTVVSVAPENDAVNVNVDTEIVVTFSEDVAISALPVLECDVSGNVDLTAELVAAIYTLTPVASLANGENCSLSLLAGSVTDVDGTADAMQNDLTVSFTTVADLNVVTPISAIQGSGDESPLVGQQALVEAVVTAVLPELDGFVVQEQAADQDADPATSEGLFVANNNNALAGLSTGDLVEVRGFVSEQFGRTQLSLSAAPEVVSNDNSLAPTPFSLPVTSLDDLEALEGMLISNSAPLTVTDNFTLGRFGRLTLSNGRLFTPTNVEVPGSAGYDARIIANSLNTIVLDDGSDEQNGSSAPLDIPFPTGGLSASNTVRSGDTVSSLTGVVDFTRGLYMVYATEAPVFAATNPRTAAPELTEGNLKVASLNVLNYFNNTGNSCGPTGSSNCRGAEDNGTDSSGRTEFDRQKLKTVAAIVAMDADIVGLMEIENNGFGQGSAIFDLVAGINAEMGEGTYAIVDAGGPVGTDAITVALIYKPSVVNLSGNLIILDSSNSPVVDGEPLFNDRRNRPSHIQKFALVENREEIVISVNHLKSKGSSCGAGDDDATTGQGSCNLTRTRAAQGLTAFLTANYGATPTLIIGDLNAYAKEDPITAILSEGYTDLANLFGGSEAYSYTFRGELGYLDHALASASLLDNVVDTTEWHINADEPIVLDYNLNFQSTAQQDAWYAPDVYRMSDHDPVVVAIQLDAAAVKGDWDGDGDVDINDYRGLLRAIQRRQPVGMEFDLNEDGRITTADARFLLSLCTRARCAA